MSRVISNNTSSPGRTILVDLDGNGDYTSIQAAIEAAHAQAPTYDHQWLVLIAPGLYPEALTLYDYVNLSGFAPDAGVIIRKSGQGTLLNAATCTLANLRLGGDINRFLLVPSSFSGLLTLRRVYMQESQAGVDSLKVEGGTVVLDNCDWTYGGSVVLAAGALQVKSSRLNHSHVTPGALPEPAIEVTGGSLLIDHSVIENTATSLSGGQAMSFSIAAPASVKCFHSVFRSCTGVSIDSSILIHPVIAGCVMNADINTTMITPGYLNYVFNAGV